MTKRECTCAVRCKDCDGCEHHKINKIKEDDCMNLEYDSIVNEPEEKKQEDEYQEYWDQCPETSNDLQGIDLSLNNIASTLKRMEFYLRKMSDMKKFEDSNQKEVNKK